MTLFIDNPAVEEILSVDDVMDALEQGHAELGHGRAINGPKFRIMTPRDPAHIEGGTEPLHHVYTSLNGAIAMWNVTANRVDSDFIHYPEINGLRREVRLPGPPSGMFCGFVQLYDTQTAEPLAIVHDGFMQKYRVGGTAGLGTKYLAKKNSKVLGLIGSGWQQTSAIECHCAAANFELVKIYSPTKENRDAFAAEYSKKLGIEVRAVDTAEEAVRGADVVNTATNAVDPVLRTEWLEPGMLITAIKDATEIEFETFERADYIVSNRNGPNWNRFAIGGTEDIPEGQSDNWGKSGDVEWDDIPLFGEVVAGLKPGRTSDDQVILFPVTGDGVQFAAVAYRLYERAKERGLGTEVDTTLWLQDAKYIP